MCARVLPFDDLCGWVGDGQSRVFAGSGVQDVRWVIVRMMPPGNLEQVILRMDLLWHWEQLGVEVVNAPKSLECTIDKYLTLVRLQSAGLPTPRTMVCQKAETAMVGFEELGGDVVVKPIFGAEGRGIVRIRNAQTGHHLFSQIERRGQVIYQQEMLDHGGSDLRLLVWDGAVIAAMRRVAVDDFRTNLAVNGRGQPYTPSPEECMIAIHAAEVVGTRLAGVDLIRTVDGELFVIEVNGVPGWKGVQEVTKIPIAERIIDGLIQS